MNVARKPGKLSTFTDQLLLFGPHSILAHGGLYDELTTVMVLGTKDAGRGKDAHTRN